MAKYYNITVQEMDSFLLSQGFSRIPPELLVGTRELVYGKRVDSIGIPLTVRVYTGIDPSGQSRDVGEDAMRVALFTKVPDPQSPGKTIIKQLFGSKRVHRVAGWAKNLQTRINEVITKASQQRICDRCGLPMILREGKSKSTGRPYSFYGCSGYPSCTNTKPA
jgi:hypothetical protein